MEQTPAFCKTLCKEKRKARLGCETKSVSINRHKHGFVPPHLFSVFLTEGLDNESAQDVSLLAALAAHAAMRASGFDFVGFDKSPENFKSFCCRWSCSRSVRVLYNLHNLFNAGDQRAQYASLVFERYAGHLGVKGSCKAFHRYSISLSLAEFQNALTDAAQTFLAMQSSSECCRQQFYACSTNRLKRGSEPGKDLFELLTVVKNEIALPLIAYLRTQILSDSLLLSLPHDVKLMILSRLSSKDIARAACVCSELESLCRNEELWMRLFREEYEHWNCIPSGFESWRDAFFFMKKGLYILSFSALKLDYDSDTDLSDSLYESLDDDNQHVEKRSPHGAFAGRERRNGANNSFTQYLHAGEATEEDYHTDDNDEYFNFDGAGDEDKDSDEEEADDIDADADEKEEKWTIILKTMMILKILMTLKTLNIT
eukprot:TRINITY_DN3042_c0_g4_i2.p1 TRINITY_DN3042_c0_g4~~TRINITY_DN3042_c0_g4_i2.p1  ORF type:complete len:428 (-),score=56.58 TRINITY_DN3042_c0_g4_i2:68-1351(-)